MTCSGVLSVDKRVARVHRAELHLGPQAPHERDIQLPGATSGTDRLHPLQPPVGEWLICEKLSLSSCSPLCVNPVQTCCCYAAFPCLNKCNSLWPTLCSPWQIPYKSTVKGGECQRTYCRSADTPWLWMCCAKLLCSSSSLHYQRGPKCYCCHVNGCTS